MEPGKFLFLHSLPSVRYPTDNGCGAANGVGLGLGLGLFLFGNGLHLVEVTAENGRVGHVLGRFGELQQHDT